MPIDLPTVLPGDPITADAWNNFIAQLKALDSRVSTLEGITPGGTGKFAITGLSSTNLNVNDPLTVFGVHFGLPAQNLVTLTVNNQTSTVPQNTYDLAASNDKQLKFPIPPLSGLGSGGLARLQIVNNNGNDTRELTINPAVVSVPTGNLAVTLTSFQNVSNPASNLVDPGGTFLLTFNIKAFTTRQDTYTLALTPTMGTAVYVDDNRSPITPPQVVVPVTPVGGPGVNVKVQLVLPGGVTTGTGAVGLMATSQLNPGLNQTSGPQSFTVGGTLPSLGTIGLATSGQTGITNGTFDSKGILQLQAGVECTLALIATIPQGSPVGNYFVSFRFDSTSNLWTSRFRGVTNPFQWATGQPTVNVGITGQANAPDTIWHVRVNAGTSATGTPFGELPIQVHVS
jgi:hypothetical protein